MVISLLVLCSPASGQGASSALRFARAAVAAGHTLRQVFFHADGVMAVLAVEVPADEPDLGAGWAALAAAHGVPLLACETALARRGLDRPAVATGAVKIGTLGQFMLAVVDSDRVLTFAD
jgi:tRNA 2-thiouridine synthesizing protein D